MSHFFHLKIILFYNREKLRASNDFGVIHSDIQKIKMGINHF